MAEQLSPPGLKNPSGTTETTPLLPSHAESRPTTEPPGTTFLESAALRAGIPVEDAAKMDPDQLDILGDANCGHLELGC